MPRSSKKERKAELTAAEEQLLATYAKMKKMLSGITTTLRLKPGQQQGSGDQQHQQEQDRQHQQQPKSGDARSMGSTPGTSTSGPETKDTKAQAAELWARAKQKQQQKEREFKRRRRLSSTQKAAAPSGPTGGPPFPPPSHSVHSPRPIPENGEPMAKQSKSEVADAMRSTFVRASGPSVADHPATATGATASPEHGIRTERSSAAGGRGLLPTPAIPPQPQPQTSPPRPQQQHTQELEPAAPSAAPSAQTPPETPPETPPGTPPQTPPQTPPETPPETPPAEDDDALEEQEEEGDHQGVAVAEDPQIPKTPPM